MHAVEFQHFCVFGYFTLVDIVMRVQARKEEVMCAALEALPRNGKTVAFKKAGPVHCLANTNTTLALRSKSLSPHGTPPRYGTPS